MRLYNKKDKEISFEDNRINVIIAIIFLFGIGVVFKLYNLQVKDFDLYSARAEDQHQLYSILEPVRGRIFINDKDDKNSGLYPVATNKEFAVLYVVPRDMNNKEKIADLFFDYFKKEKAEKEVDEILKKEDEDRLLREINFANSFSEEERASREAAARAEHAQLMVDKDYLKIKELKKEEEMKKRKEAAVTEYLRIFNKPGDPYEPIEKKVDYEILKKIYLELYLLNNNDLNNIDLDKVEVKDNKVFLVEDGIKELKIEGIGFLSKVYRFYPEHNIGSHILGFVGFVGDEERGRYGLEGFFDEELFGVSGSMKAGKGAGGNLVIVNDREYTKAINGKDMILTIDRTIQFTVCQKLNKAAEKHGADGGSVIVMDPYSGGIIAMCSWEDYDPNNYREVEDMDTFNNDAIFYQYEPGSTFKTITMAAALDQGKVTPQTTYNDEGSIMVNGWDKPIKNSDFETHGAHGISSMTNVLELSLNTGAIYAMERVGAKIFTEYVKNFGFGEKTGIELETESAGDIRELKKDKIKEIYAATASYGQGFTVTPLQLVTAYAAIANGGILMKPYLVKEIVNADGVRESTQPRQIRRVISERAATLLSGMLASVVESGHAKQAGVSGYFVAGKTGTAQVASQTERGYGTKTIQTFVGFAPLENPRFVMLVKLDDPKDVDFAASSAAPLFGEISEFLLNYLEAPKEREVR